jgi:hypothetical protein
LDSPYCQRDLLKRHLDEAVKQDAHIHFNGDTFDLMGGRRDFRGSKGSLRPEFKVDHYFDEIVNNHPNKIHFLIFAPQSYNMQQQEPAQNQLNIELSEEMAEGIYSNLAIITHSNAEFVVDFINVMPSAPKAKVKSRILLTPQHAKRLLLALKDNIQKFESNFGPIKEGESHSVPMGFGGPQAQA